MVIVSVVSLRWLEYRRSISFVSQPIPEQYAPFSLTHQEDPILEKILGRFALLHASAL